MRPERSVMHSPRLTNRNGVETRMAPPNTASGTVQSPIVPSAISGPTSQKANSSIKRITCKNEDEDNSLHHKNRGVRQTNPAFHQPPPPPASPNQDSNPHT